MKVKFLTILMILSIAFAMSAKALTVTGSWGNKPKAIQGDDGGKWMTWTPGQLKAGSGAALGLSDDSSVFYPNGDGTWSITLKYSPGYTITLYKLLYSDTDVTNRAGAKKASWDFNTWNSENFDNGHSNVTIPDTATGSYTIAQNWNDTPWALGATTFKATPDSGQILLYWSAQVNLATGAGDVDAAETGDNFGYKIWRATAAAGPYSYQVPDSAGADTYLNQYNVTAAGNYTLIGGNGYKLVDNSGVVNGTTYYYIIFATDAYSTTSDTSGKITGIPAAWINVIFTVEGIDWSKVQKEFNYNVYLTPWLNGHAYFNHKIPAKIAAVYVPKA